MSKAAELAALIANVNNGSSLANKNFIINGAMNVAQRGTSAVTAATNYHSVDRFKAWEDTDGAFTVEQSTTAPVGFAYSFKAQVTTADGTMGASQYSSLSQQIEGQNLQSLLYGTSSAKTITLSFHVRSSKTGSYSITFYKGARSGTSSYLFSKSYTIDSANTWEKKTITITPDSQIKASAGAIANDNGIGIYLFWNLSGGTNQDDATDNAWSSNTSHYHTSSQVNWMDSTSNDFYLTGVQLEVGEKATEFEHEPFETTLRKCQRYFYRTPDGGSSGTSTAYQHLGNGYMHNSTECISHFVFPEVMRSTPTCTFSGEVQLLDFSGARDPGSNIAFESPTSRSVQPQLTVSGATQGHGAVVRLHNDADGYIQADAEL